jgi:preprotein translocase subunit YajC
MELLSLLAQADPAAPAPGGGAAPPGWLIFLTQFGPLLLILVVFWFLIVGSKRKQDRQRQEMLNSIKKGDRVQTIGGILGNVMDVRDDRVVLKVDESSNTKIAFAKSAVHRVLADDGKADNKV